MVGGRSSKEEIPDWCRVSDVSSCFGCGLCGYWVSCSLCGTVGVSSIGLVRLVFWGFGSLILTSTYRLIAIRLFPLPNVHAWSRVRLDGFAAPFLVEDKNVFSRLDRDDTRARMIRPLTPHCPRARSGWAAARCCARGARAVPGRGISRLVATYFGGGFRLVHRIPARAVGFMCPP